MRRNFLYIAMRSFAVTRAVRMAARQRALKPVTPALCGAAAQQLQRHPRAALLPQRLARHHKPEARAGAPLRRRQLQRHDAHAYTASELQPCPKLSTLNFEAMQRPTSGPEATSTATLQVPSGASAASAML